MGKMLGIALSWKEYQQTLKPENSGDALFTLIPYEEARAIARQRAELQEFFCCYWLGWTVDENLASHTISFAEFMDRMANGLAWLNPMVGEEFDTFHKGLPCDILRSLSDAFHWDLRSLEMPSGCLSELEKYGLAGAINLGCKFDEPYESVEIQEMSRSSLPDILAFFEAFPSFIGRFTLTEVDKMVQQVFWDPGDIIYNYDEFCYEAMVRASIVPFRDYLPFAGPGEEIQFFMWFDNFEWQGEGPAPQYLKDVLKDILLIDNDHCQLCAYHGVNHLPTQADRDEVLLSHLAGPIAEERNRPYAESCLLGLEM